MASIVVVEHLPYNCAYRRLPFGGYNSSFPEYWSGDRCTYYDTLMYGGNPYLTFVVEAPFTGHASLAKKRKLEGLKGEVTLRGGHGVRNIFVESDSKSSPSSPLSKSMRSSTVSSGEATKDTQVYEPPQGNATESNHSFVPSVGIMSPHPRVISIPVISTNDGKDSCVKCTVVPQQGTKKLRKAAMSSDGAAILIQAWFRGYQVRKTKPLTQLRCIAKVKLQLTELDEKVSDANYMNHARENMAGRASLTEGIMTLLLQLDAIQGAYPVVREIRKVTTKEVISLQGRVDDLLTTEKTFPEPSQLPMEVEEASRDKVNWEILPATESSANDSVTMGFVDVEEKQNPCDCNIEEQPNILHTSHVGFENDMTYDDLGTQLTEPDSDQGNGEAGALLKFGARKTDIVEDQGNGEAGALLKFGARKTDIVEIKKTSYTMSTQMAEPDQDEGNGEVVAAEFGPERMDLESSKDDVEGNNKSVASDMGGNEFQTEQSSEAHTQHDIAFENEPSSELRNEDGKDREVGFDGAKTIAGGAEQVEADTERMNASAEQAVQSGDIPEISRRGNLESNEEEDREQFDDRTNESGPNATGDLTDDGEVVHTLIGKHYHSPPDSSLPHSPRSPLEAQGCLDCSLSSSDNESPSESQESTKMVHEASLADNQALLLKLTEENKALKSLLVTIMKWNQMHATAMQDEDQRLINLEGRMSPRNGKKKLNSRRRGGKSSRMMLR